ncbi:MAG: ROK family protein [Anaerolineaceae bacterium]|nr:MAG: ROK family protein [Anaerolineaceae bacterium]
MIRKHYIVNKIYKDREQNKMHGTLIGMNQRNMNDKNKGVLLKSIVTQGPMSRVKLSKLLGLSKMTITGIVNEYLAKGILQECGSASSTGGRKPMFLDVVPNSLLSLGVSIGRDVIQVGIINLKGEVIQSENLPFAPIVDGDAFLGSIFYLCDELLKHKLRSNIWGIGVSCAGPLSIQNGIILNPPDFNDIRDIHITKELHERYSLPTYLHNDMCTAALAEMYFGNTENYNSFAYIGISAGIGAGIIIDKKIYSGTMGLAGAIGHSTVERNGYPCECGQRGCLEKYSSTKAVLEWAKNNGAEDDITWFELVRRANKGDSICQKAIERMIDYLGVAINNMQMALDIECIFIGGDLYFFRDTVVNHIKDKLQSQSLAWSQRRRVKVEASSFMGNASFIGIAAMVMENNLTV